MYKEVLVNSWKVFTYREHFRLIWASSKNTEIPKKFQIFFFNSKVKRRVSSSSFDILRLFLKLENQKITSNVIHVKTRNLASLLRGSNHRVTIENLAKDVFDDKYMLKARLKNVLFKKSLQDQSFECFPSRTVIQETCFFYLYNILLLQISAAVTFLIN